MIDNVKESIIHRISELVPTASPSAIKNLTASLDLVSKIGKETADEKYLNGMLEIFNRMREQSESFNRSLSSYEALSLTDIAKAMGGKDDNKV